MYQVLLVDDEQLTLDYLTLSIPQQDSDWVIANTCSDALSALEWLEGHSVDLIITDIKMPEMSGLELCQAVTAKNPKQSIVILSGYDEFEFARQAIKYGVRDYLLKPISLANLKKTLDAAKEALSAQKAEEYVYSRLMQMSEEGKFQIVSRFIQAVITNSYVEIKYLHPVIHRMKIKLLDGAGVLMLLTLDRNSLLAKKIPTEDIPLYRYILYRLALELSEQYPENIWISLDHNEDVVALLSADTYPAACDKAKEYFENIRKNRFPHMDLPLSGGQSAAFEDILSIFDAYQEASTALKCRQLDRTDRLYLYTDMNDAVKARINALGENGSLPLSNDNVPEKGVVDQALQYLHEHYAEPISLALIAEETGVSPNYLSTLFHNETGKSYIKYLTEIRMEQAVEYMKRYPHMKIYEIAEKVGYISVKHFSYVFKQHFSVSPGEYQQLHFSTATTS